MNPSSSSKAQKVLFVFLSFALLIIVSYKLSKYHILETPIPEVPATTTPATSTEPVVEEPATHGNGIVSFSVPKEFGLATHKDQILVKSYIPACDDNMDYCLYYNGTEYENTNFESAGVRIKKRADLVRPSQCLTAEPLGYAKMKSTLLASTTSYMLSVFSPIGDAGAGHYSAGELYRLAYNGSCHEFETRIGASQFANYPEGTINEFTKESQADVTSKLTGILNNITLATGEKVQFVK